MTLHMYDTKSRSVQPITTQDNTVAMYCCGPTVYRDAHVGNLRTFLLSDLIARVISISGVKVKRVQNITDVGHMAEDIVGDDKMLAQAKLESRDPFAIARKYEERFHIDLARLNIEPALVSPRASGAIALMIQTITQLIASKNAYVGSDGSVYFAASSFPSYGDISGNRLAALKPGHRYEYVDDGAKRFHADWALWKSAGNRTELVWDSPWGVGFPGWHIECTAMSLHYLAGHINIHVGGIDLRFPHHENERAQSNSITDTEAVDMWVHGEHLLFEGRKMSKSANNVVLLADVISRGFDPLSLRLCFLENRYRSQMDLNWQSIATADATLRKWRRAMSEWGDNQNILADIQIAQHLNKDLDTPRALQRLRSIEKDLTIAPENKGALFNYADQILGLDLSRTEARKPLPEHLLDLFNEREKARADKQWQRSDELRVLLEAQGLAITDGPHGQSWNWS